MTLEAVIFIGGPWWLLQRGPKTMLSVVPGYCGLSCPHPHPNQGPSSSLGPEGAAFPSPPPPGTTWALAVGLHGTEQFFQLWLRTPVLCTHKPS